MNKPSTSHSMHDKMFVGLLCLVFLLPWPQGGELNWEYLPFMACIFAMLAVLLMTSGDKLAGSCTAAREAKIPLTLLLCWLAYQFLQALPLGDGLVQVLNPPAVEIRSMTLPASGAGTMSIAPGLTLFEALKNASYVGFFIVALLLAGSETRILAVVQVMFAASSAMALYSLINHYTNGSISVFTSNPPWTISWKDAAHGSFSYQNHYASFLTLTIPLGLGLIYEAGKRQEGHYAGRHRSGRQAMDFLLSSGAVYLAGTVLMVLALVKTASRGGNITFLASMLLTCCGLMFAGRYSKATIARHAAVLLILLLAVIASGAANRLLFRYSVDGLDPHGRDARHETAIGIAREFPVFGSGAGTYPVLQPMFKVPELGNSATSRRAHSDYLELLSDQGFVGTALIGIAMAMLYGKVLAGLGRYRSNLYGVHAACFCSITAMLIYAVADFNFHLPVNAVYFYLLLALGFTLPRSQGASLDSK